MVRQDNITHDGTYPGRIKEEKGYTYTHTYTHDTDYPTLLLRDIQLINTECTPCKHRTDAEPTQNLRSGYAGLIKSGYRTETVTGLGPDYIPGH